MRTTQHLKLFPTIEEVFQNPTEEYKTIFFPLLTIDLAALNKGEGKIHFISVFASGLPEYTFPKDKSGYNFIIFKRMGDNKYAFEADIKEMPLIDKAIEWYKEAEEIYKEHKEKYFIKTGGIEAEDEKRYKIDKEYSRYIKGVTNYWVTRDKFLETGKFIQGGAYTYGNSNQEREIIEGEEYAEDYDFEYFEELLEELNIDFQDLTIAGYVTAYNYINFGEDEILLSVNPKTGEVLQYFSWS